MYDEATTPPWANKNSYVRDVLRPIEQHGDYINRATFWFQISKLCHKPKNVLLFNYSHLLRIFPWYIHKFFWVKLYQKFGNSSKKNDTCPTPPPQSFQKGWYNWKIWTWAPFGMLWQIFSLIRWFLSITYMQSQWNITFWYIFISKMYWKVHISSLCTRTIQKTALNKCLTIVSQILKFVMIQDCGVHFWTCFYQNFHNRTRSRI